MAPKKHPFCHMTLKLVSTKEQFDSIELDRLKDEGKSFNDMETSVTKNVSSREDLIIPRCGKIPNYEEFRSSKVCSRKDVLISGYQRLRQSQNLPNTETYEPSERDLRMISHLKEKFGQSINIDLEWKEIFVLLIKLFEKLYHMTSDVTLSSSFQLPQFFGNQSLSEEINKQIFNYWRGMKAQVCWFPLARNYWPRSQKNPQIQINQIVIPFKRRKFKSVERKLMRKKTKKGISYVEGLFSEKEKRNGELTESKINAMRDGQYEKNERFGLSVSKFHEIVKRILPKTQKKELNTKQHAKSSINNEIELINKKLVQQQVRSPLKYRLKTLDRLSSSNNPQFYRRLNERFQTNFGSLMLRMKSKLAKKSGPVQICVDQPEFCKISGEVSEIGEKQFKGSLMIEVLGQLRKFLNEEEGQMSQGRAQIGQIYREECLTKRKQQGNTNTERKECNCSQIEEIGKDYHEFDSFKEIIRHDEMVIDRRKEIGRGRHKEMVRGCKEVDDCEDTMWQRDSKDSEEFTVNSQSQISQVNDTL